MDAARHVLILLCLTASAAARTMAAQSDPAPAAVGSGTDKSSFGRGLDLADCCEVEKRWDMATALTLATEVSRFSAIDGRIEECCVCMAGVPCLCSVAAEPQLAAAGLSVTGILALYAGPCKVWHLGGTTAAVLAAKVAVSASCTPKALPLLMMTCVLRDPKELVVVYVDLVVGGGGVPCLSRAAVEFVTVVAGLKARDLLAIYNACGGGLRLGGADHKVAVAPYEWYRLPPPPPQHLYGGCGKGSFGRGLSCCEVVETGGDKQATASLAIRLSRFCVLDTVVVGPPCLAGTAILELFTGTRGGTDEYTDWHLKAPHQQGATTEAHTVAASASSCTPRTRSRSRLTLLVVSPHVLRDRTVKSCKAVAGNLVTRFRSWSFVECPGSLLIFAFLVALLIAFTSKQEERELKWKHAQGLQPLHAKLFHDKTAYNELTEEAKQRTDITRWQESLIWFKGIFSTSEQRSNPHVLIYNVSRNDDICYSAFHSFHRKEHTRFMIMSIIVLGFLAIHPVKAAPDSLNVDLYYGGETEEYGTWSDAIHYVGISRSRQEFRRDGQKLTLLVDQTYPNEPIAWINVTIHDGDEWARFLQRIDNFYVVLYENSRARHSLQEYTNWFPDAIDLKFDGSYVGINGERDNLTEINFNMANSRSDLWILSRYRHGVDDPFPMKVAFTRYVVILGEAQRFTEVDQCIRDGWANNCYLKRPKELFVHFDDLSCGALEDWEPKSTEEHPLTNKELRERRHTYKRTLKKLGITEKEAPGLLRVMLKSKVCAHNTKDVFYI